MKRKNTKGFEKHREGNLSDVDRGKKESRKARGGKETKKSYGSRKPSKNTSSEHRGKKPQAGLSALRVRTATKGGNFARILGEKVPNVRSKKVQIRPSQRLTLDTGTTIKGKEIHWEGKFNFKDGSPTETLPTGGFYVKEEKCLTMKDR